jgi:hypothetical protein
LIKVLLALFLCAPAFAQASYAERPEVEAFVRDLARRHGLEEAELKRVFERAAPRPGARGDCPPGRARAHLG